MVHTLQAQSEARRSHREQLDTVAALEAELRASVRGEVRVSLTNTAPSSGLPRAVAGPAEGSEDQFVYVQNRALF